MPRVASSSQAIGFPCALLSTVKLPPPPEQFDPQIRPDFPNFPNKRFGVGLKLKPNNPHGSGEDSRGQPTEKLCRANEDPDRIGGP